MFRPTTWYLAVPLWVCIVPPVELGCVSSIVTTSPSLLEKVTRVSSKAPNLLLKTRLSLYALAVFGGTETVRRGVFQQSAQDVDGQQTKTGSAPAGPLRGGQVVAPFCRA